MPIKEALAMARNLAAEIRMSLVAARRSLVVTRRTKAARRNLMMTRRIPTQKRTMLGETGRSLTRTKMMRRGKTRASNSSLAQANKMSSTAETYRAGGATVETETTDLMDLRIATEETGGVTILVGIATTTGPGKPATGNQQTAITGERKTTAERPATRQVTKTPEVRVVVAAAAATTRNIRNGVWVRDETAVPVLRGRGWGFQNSEKEESEARRRKPEATAARDGMVVVVAVRTVQEVAAVRGLCREADQGIDTDAITATAAAALQKGPSSISMIVEARMRGNREDGRTELPGLDLGLVARNQQER